MSNDSKNQGEHKDELPKQPSSTNSFFDMTDRHTSHLSSPAAQSVEWTERKGINNVPEGLSKPKSKTIQNNKSTGETKRSIPNNTTKSANTSFIPATSFLGAKEGYQFQTGISGVGYYKSTKAATPTTTETISPPPTTTSKPTTTKPASSSFFDFEDRHTSHLSSPAAQSVEWTERKGINTVPEGISKIDTDTKSTNNTTTSEETYKSKQTTTTTTPPLPPSSTSSSSNNTNFSRTGTRKVYNVKQTSSPSRKSGSIPGYRNAQQKAATSSSSVVSYDVVFIMNQLALNKITQEQFDILNALLR